MTGKFGKMLGMALAVCMIVSCLTGYGKEEVKADQTPVKYLDYNESSKSFEEKICNAYSVVGTSTTSMTGQDSWYVVNGVVTVSGRINVTGTVNLILMNGCKLTASEGIEVNRGNTLIIYRQARNEGTTTTPGELVATGITNAAVIGSGEQESGGNITINGGTITATGINLGAGIGGGYKGAGGNIAINGGAITAFASEGAGIGSGDSGNGGNITINGGTVNATSIAGGGIGDGSNRTGGNITITLNGGTITAFSEYGSGIGKGADTSGTGTYSLGTGMKGFSSASENSGYSSLSNSFSDTSHYAIVYRENGFIPSVSNDTITARYIADGNRKSITLRIQEPTDIIRDNVDSAKAKLVGCDTFNTALGRTGADEVSESQIKYYNSDGQELTSVPTVKGSYTAKITVDGFTASVNYSITKYIPVVTPPVGATLTFNGGEQPLITGGSTTGGTLKYSLSENGTFSTDIPKGRDGGPYTVYYKVEGNDDYKSTTVSHVSAEIRRASLSLSLSQAGWVKGSTAPGPVLSGNEGGGAVTYAYKKQSEDDAAYVSAVPTESGNYVVRATVAETGNYLGGTVTAEFTITEPASGQNPDQGSGSDSTQNPDQGSGSDPATTPDQGSGSNPTQNPDPGSGSNPAPAPQPVYIPAEPVREGTKAEAENYTKIVVNPDGTISEISVTKLKDGSIITSETVRDKDGKFVEYKYEYTRTAKNGTTCVKSFNKIADGSQNETFVTTTKSGTVSTVVKEVTADGTVISKEGKSYADGRTSIKEAITGSDGVTKVITEKTDAAGNGVWAEYTAITDDSVGDEGTNTSGAKEADISGVEGADASGAAGADTKNRASHKATKVSLTTAEVIGTTFKIPGEIWVNEQHFVVTEIAKNLLKNNKTVSKLTIGENITKIGASAFRNMTGLKKITINAANLEEIGKNAFKGVGDKKTVTIIIKGVTEAEFEKICEMIRAAGIGKKVKFVMG